jgi:hypothetical protein
MGDPRVPAFALMVLFALIALYILRDVRRKKAGAAASPPLKPAIDRSTAAVRAIVSDIAPVFEVLWIGAVEISPRHFAIWTFLMSDTDRDRVKATPGLEDRLRQAVADAGYPADAVAHVGFAFESKETVDRDFAGNFWYAMT